LCPLPAAVTVKEKDMRKIIVPLAVFSVFAACLFVFCGQASAGEYLGSQYAEYTGGCSSCGDGGPVGSCGDSCCDPCCRPRCGLLRCLSACGGCGAGHQRRSWFNCNCNGSYKFPVPPLYTYHWPGLYSQQLMTNYHSPWRFPPITPFPDEEENPSTVLQTQGYETAPLPGSVRPVSAYSQPGLLPRPRRVGEVEPMSEKLKRLAQ